MLRLSLILIWLLVPLSADGQPVLYVDPDGLGDIGVGDTFTMDLRIANYDDLRAYSIELHYNQAAIQHTNLTQGSVFSVNGGPGGIFLTAASDAERGYIKADEARITGGSASGDDGLLFRITFLAIAPGSTNVDFGQVQLRNAANESLAFDAEGGVAAVVSPVPDSIYTKMFDPGEGSDGLVEWPQTGGWLNVDNAGSVPHGKLSVARYTSLPPGGEDAPFLDPDGQILQLGVATAYWEATSSLDGESIVSYGFSYAELDGPADPTSYRIARRSLGSSPDSVWTVLPLSATDIDGQLDIVRVDGLAEPFQAAQYALVFDRTVSSANVPDANRGITLEVFPNPAREDASVRFHLDRAAVVVVHAVDLLGRPVLAIADEALPPGEHEIQWSPRLLPPGTYVLILRESTRQASTRFTVVR